MRNSIWNKKIPSLLGMLLLFFGVGLTSYMVQQGVITISKASPVDEPKNVRITNISDTSFTISYSTTTPVLGTLSYKTDTTESKVALDDRDQATGTPAPYTLHHITVKSAKASTTYKISITSGSTTYINGENPYTVTTVAAITTPPSTQNPLAGIVTSATGGRPDEALLYVTVDGQQTLSTLIKKDGNYLLPLNNMRDAALTSYTTFTDSTKIKLLVVGAKENAVATVTPKQTNPVPAITLGQEYDFSTNATPSPSAASPSASLLATFPSFSATEVSKNSSTAREPTLIAPSKGTNDQQPVFQGVGVPNETVTVEIHSEEVIKDTIKTTASGSWSYRPKTPLSPGNHTITITTKNTQGILKKITQSFVVYAEGSKSIEPSVAPPSVTPTITPTPTQKPSPTPTKAPSTPTPTKTVLPSATPTLSLPTATPTISIGTPTMAISPTPTIAIPRTISPTPQLPTTGSSESIILTILGVAVMSTGLLLFMLTRGARL